jgi:hypothetical protein
VAIALTECGVGVDTLAGQTDFALDEQRGQAAIRSSTTMTGGYAITSEASGGAQCLPRSGEVQHLEGKRRVVSAGHRVSLTSAT